MARHPFIQDLLDQFVVPAKTTGVQRAVWTLYRTLANNLAQQLSQDSGELIEALQLLKRSRDLATIGGVNPRPVPSSAVPQSRIRNMAPAPSVEVGDQE